jgi:hypothetical protein
MNECRSNDWLLLCTIWILLFELFAFNKSQETFLPLTIVNSISNANSKLPDQIRYF